MRDKAELLNIEPTPDDGDEALFKAICLRDDARYYQSNFRKALQSGKVWLIDKILETGRIDLNSDLCIQDFFSDYEKLPLTCALDAKQGRSILLLLERGADPNRCREDLMTPFIQQEQWDFVKAILSYGAPVSRNSWSPFLKTIYKGNFEVAELMRQRLPEKIPIQLVELMKDAAPEGFDLSSLLVERPPVLSLPLPVAAIPPETAPVLPVVVEALPPVLTKSDWVRSDEAEITYIRKKPIIGECLKDIFNFETRERVTIFEGIKSGSRTALRENFSDIENRDILERACDEFISQDGKIDKAAIMTRGFMSRDKRKLT